MYGSLHVTRHKLLRRAGGHNIPEPELVEDSICFVFLFVCLNDGVGDLIELIIKVNLCRKIKMKKKEKV